MRERTPFKQNTELRVTNHAGGEMRYVIGEVTGMGGSCIVYDGYYLNNAGARNTVRIKECYPYKLHLERGENGELTAAEHETGKFEEYKQRIRRSFEIANEFNQIRGLTNLTTNVFDRYEANNTVYIVSTYVEGDTLSAAAFDSLRDVIRAVISTAKSIDRIHRQGYLYLDVKPENILMYQETPELIQLFDFDSVIPIDSRERMTDYRTGYTTGFAPLEQKTGSMSLIGKHTDVYSIGALLFWLLFGRTPRTTDCGKDALYDYSRLKWDHFFQKKVYRELTVFFRHTLQPYYKDRYPDMSGVIAQLEEIAKYADLPVPFICSACVTGNPFVVGREQECGRILDWYQSEEQVLFVTGMGGIGKSTIVRKFAGDHAEHFDHLIYLRFRYSVCDTIADDLSFCVSGCEKDMEESTEEYFLRKIKLAARLAAGTDSLLIIDDFDGVINEDFHKLLDVDWKMIVITRKNMSRTGYVCHEIGTFRDEKDFRLLFEQNLGRRMCQAEYRRFDRIVELAAGHTLILTLIARQMARSGLMMDEALYLLSQNSFSQMAPEQVAEIRDGERISGNIAAILRNVYDASALTERKRRYLKMISVFDIPDMKMRKLLQLLELPTLDEINELGDLGWLEIAGGLVQMHPLVREVVRQIPWTEDDRRLIQKKMKRLYLAIRQSDRREEAVAKSQAARGKGKGRQEDIMERFVRRRTAEKGEPGAEWEDALPDPETYNAVWVRLSGWLTVSKAVLSACKEDEALHSGQPYKKLLYVTLMHLPEDQESYIARHAEELLDGDMPWSDREVMELYDYVVYLLCQKEEYRRAQEYLNRAANMMWEFADAQHAWWYLEKACRICDAHPDSIPYIRKKLELLEHELEICDRAGDWERCRRVIRRLDRLNLEAAEFHLERQVPEEVRRRAEKWKGGFLRDMKISD